MSQTKAAQPVPVQPLAMPATATPLPALNPMQPSVAPAAAPAAPVAGAKPPAAKSVAMTSGAEMSAKSSALRRAEVLSILYKYGMCVRKRRSRGGVKMAAAVPNFFARRGVDTVRLARYLGTRFDIPTLRDFFDKSKGSLDQNRFTLSALGAGATGAAGLGAAGLGYGAYRALGGGEE